MITDFLLFFLHKSSHPHPSTLYEHHNRLGCAPNLSQNMFFTGTTTIPLDVMHQNHQSVAMTQNRTPPTLFQYPTSKSICFLHLNKLKV